MKDFAKNKTTKGEICAALVFLVLVVVAPAAAQKNKDKNKVAPTADSSTDSKSLLPDSRVIDQTVSEALGYWQIGDIVSMHKYYSDDVLVVSGAWEQPVIGWENYVKVYQAQRARVTSDRLDRTNIYTKVYGNSAWTTYQWEYTGLIDGSPFGTRGHTTLVLNKQSDHWIIVLDHSSIVSEAGPASSAPSAVPAQSGRR